MDGAKDGAELRAGANPFAVDTDGDGFWDSAEIEQNTSAVDRFARPVSLIANTPVVQALRFGTAAGGIGGNASICATPEVQVFRYGNGPLGNSFLSASPLVFAVRLGVGPGEGGIGSFGGAAIHATPVVHVLRYGPAPGEPGFGCGCIISTPTIFVVPGTFGVPIATPPVTIQIEP
jgi:hypothetical protein